jgi:hypothetical protein
MPRYDLAHIHQQGVDLIIIPLNSSFGSRSQTEQQEVVGELQLHANAAGLKGTVVPVWDSLGRMAFIAPQDWHPFFKSINLQFVRANINRYISW